MPHVEKWYPGNKKRKDAEIGNTSAWPVVERAKNAGVREVTGWRRDKSVESVANELRCFAGINAIIGTLEEKIRERRKI